MLVDAWCYICDIFKPHGSGEDTRECCTVFRLAFENKFPQNVQSILPKSGVY